MGNTIDGNIVASVIKSRVKKEIDDRKSKGLVIPSLATVLVGDDPASAIYVKNKQKAASDVGIRTKDHRMGSNINQKRSLN